MEKLKQNKTVEHVRICEGSPVDVRWAVQWVAEDLWWEELPEKVCQVFYNEIGF